MKREIDNLATPIRTIIFSAEDFDPILVSKGLDPESITDYQWSKFIDMFLEGTNWSEIAEYAAEDIVLYYSKREV